MGFDESSISKKTIAEQIAERLLFRIFSGYYEQGQRLIEAEIAKELQVSHAPVREALYLLQKDGVVEKVQHKGVRVKTISDQELKDYLEALYYLLDSALTKCEPKWNADLQNELLLRFEAMKQRKSAENIYEYVVSFAHLLQLFFDVTGNIAMLRFFKETIFVTNVAAQTKWKMDLVESYHLSINTFIRCIEVSDFNHARVAIKDVILWYQFK
ncbi:MULTISPECIES: GntR family transcriptional regulator [unclassified Lysinibacillus]|jgi:DNA-binding GntR family transcriptional regulator|uniref:GntR family transcriptional regulator n=1 Tax=unclassified Lysinibacillus TaxID=2636778 RepID=UPI00073864EB|nr:MULTISPECIES: GntR family transcriptional regulator [unclassified Lysinibacillus]KUF36734.1 GntR family transcriptional regulator [Lysinibacillus sp. F5]SCX94669.1 transcriptional regulator, GntR family [Lysinibacillus sp. SG9]SDB07310.1 transcriptional regulator, GntR family [Lysinibacillus sp. TC-37]SFS39476.1 transcriptional regulator, GntR family [Lysinibacillus sp. SG55]